MKGVREEIVCRSRRYARQELRLSLTAPFCSRPKNYACYSWRYQSIDIGYMPYEALLVEGCCRKREMEALRGSGRV